MRVQCPLVIAPYAVWIAQKVFSFSIDFSFMGVRYCEWCIWNSYLLDGATNEAAKAKLGDRVLLKQFQEVEHLSAEDKDVIKKLLDAFLTKKQLQILAR